MSLPRYSQLPLFPSLEVISGLRMPRTVLLGSELSGRLLPPLQFSILKSFLLLLIKWVGPYEKLSYWLLVFDQEKLL